MRKAKKELDSANNNFGELEAIREQAESKLEDEELDVKGLGEKLKQVKQENSKVQKDIAEATKKWEEASKIADQAMRALISFDKIKALVTTTIAKMWLYFSDAVLTPLNDLGVKKGMEFDEFFIGRPDYETEREYETLKSDLEDISKHCDYIAKPAFKRVKKLELQEKLLDMCEFTPAAETSEDFATSVLAIGEQMHTNLKNARDWHDPLKGHPELTEEKLQELKDEGEPAGLRDIENSLSPSSYFSNYLERWKKDGEFLGLLKELTALKQTLSEKSDEIQAIMDDLSQKLRANTELQKQTQKE